MSPISSQKPTKSDGNMSVSPAEIDQFAALADKWWLPNGPMSLLHAINRVRVDWAINHIQTTWRSYGQPIKILDAGCGGGVAAEALAASGLDILGVDAGSEVIAAAELHKQNFPLPSGSGSLSYRNVSIEQLIQEHVQFHAITAFELIEHVNDPESFLVNLSKLLKPNGVLIISTLNRTLKSLLIAKLGAEYILRMLPTGTHHWDKFIRPNELDKFAGNGGLRTADTAGISLTLTGWKITHDLSMNYLSALYKG